MRHLYFFLILLSFSACIRNERKDLPFKQIQIQFYPSFISPSTITLDMNDSSAVFTRIGSKELFSIRRSPDTIIVGQAPSGFKFNLDRATYEKIQTISFLNEDLIDQERACDDGIWTNIVFNRNKDGIIDIEIRNATTKNQNTMILELLNEARKNAPDSLTATYLKNLKKYYRNKND